MTIGGMVGLMILGKVVGSRDHSQYLVAAFREGEVDPMPSKVDIALGNFVRVGDGEIFIVGIIISSQIISDTGLGMHFSPSGDMEMFTPELLNGAVHVLVVNGIGIMGPDGPQEVGIPSTAPSVHDQVMVLDPEEIRRFHMGSEGLNLGYLSSIATRSDSCGQAACMRSLKTLSEYIPEKKKVIDLIVQELEWNTRLGL